MPNTRKLLSIGHSYVVKLNRRLVNEIARLGQREWEVTAVAPSFMHGDLRSMHLEADLNEICRLQALPVYFSKPAHILTYDWRLKKIMQQGWNLVHCWEEPYIVAGGQIAWWTPKNTPLVYSSFQNKSKRYPPPFNWIEQYAMNRATGWITGGQTVVETLKHRQGYSLPMRLIPFGVDIDHFYPCVNAKHQIRRFLSWEEQGTPVIGFLGRFVSEKGLDLLMRVLDSLQTPWRALFVGNGSMESSLRTWAKRYPEQVRICTDVKHSEVPQYLNAMDILVAPSQTVPNWREQFGRMLIEAFACGIPVIGSDSGEIPYVIQDAGLVVSEKDESGWVAAISDLLNSPSRRQELAQKGLERSHTLYAWPFVAKQHLQFFNDLLDNKN
ncbi:glycosyltransferase family 4 protein [Halotia branconii]|uniref:Glycosyltransferase family 4 protein n=1 Tax=Halotia branconii CENA392 TaxID=1539056 RepID=A0AAJ6PCS3_9CYAN|nr:glycosyltransferase family 4 protein [Halotia branconii]WGV29220.1 glycosyltransferase family 4 protein [Halotia branconii CENA392]